MHHEKQYLLKFIHQTWQVKCTKYQDYVFKQDLHLLVKKKQQQQLDEINRGDRQSTSGSENRSVTMEMTVDCLGAQRWSRKSQLKVQQLWSETHTLKHTHGWQTEN